MCQAQYLYIYLAVFFVRLQDKPSHHRYITVTRGCKLMILNDKSKPYNLKVVGSSPTPATDKNTIISVFYKVPDPFGYGFLYPNTV